VLFGNDMLGVKSVKRIVFLTQAAILASIASPKLDATADFGVHYDAG
jgi:hypothetical protein